MKFLNCEICLSPLQLSANAVVSPWVRSLGVNRRRVSKYMTCNNCFSGFFDFRYSETDMSKIYSNYRGEIYVKARIKWEPWYNQAFNHEHDSADFVSMRQASLYRFLHKLLPNTPKTIVDVGGDRGQYIPNFGQIENYVIESSSKEVVNGVTRLSTLDEKIGYDLILYSHVLEHVAKPREEVEMLLRHSDLLYVEVPFGLPYISKTRKSKIRFLLKIFRSLAPVMWTRSSKPATGRSSQKGVLVQSEHINFFSEKSLQMLADSLDLEVHIEITSINTPDRAEATVIQCLFSRPKGKKHIDYNLEL